MPRQHRLAIGVAAAIGLTLVLLRAPLGAQGGATLPEQFSNQEFWTLAQSLSEPDGTMTTEYQADNLVSNEFGLQKVLPELTDRHPAGGVYLGVGPEQNFTYIAALKPRIAFIVDIRRGNRDLHLLYKAVFELSHDRADFVSLLFSRPRPDGLTTKSTAADIFSAFESVRPNEPAFRANLGRVTGHLTKTRRLNLSAEEVTGIGYVYGSFFRHGPSITYDSSRQSTSSNSALLFSLSKGRSYSALMQATDANDEARSYLSSEDRFLSVKDLETRNLLIPVIGNFAGPKALRAIGDWLRSRRAVVSAFYVSNVEGYLRRPNTWPLFCQNAATLPADETSHFIRSGISAGPVPATPGSPTVTGYSGSGEPSGWTSATTITLRYSDGTSRQVTAEEAAKLLPQFGAGPNHLALIADEVKACRGTAPATDHAHLPVTPKASR